MYYAGITELKVRQQLVRQRTAVANQVRGLLCAWGVNLPARFLARKGSWKELAAKRALPGYLPAILQTMLGVYEQLTRAIGELGTTLELAARKDRRVERLRSIPGVGPLSALTLVSAIDDVKRFQRAKQLTSYCGIVPTVRPSGEREQQGSIARQGRSEVRAMWIQAAHSLAQSQRPAARPLQRWFARVVKRRGFRTAIVALARKMLSLAFYLLRDGTRYEPLRLGQAAA
jgi:transposase